VRPALFGKTNDQDPRIQGFKLVLAVVHLHHVITTMDSAQMAKKDEQHVVTVAPYLSSSKSLDQALQLGIAIGHCFHQSLA
jgi:hypothetical protein